MPPILKKKEDFDPIDDRHIDWLSGRGISAATAHRYGLVATEIEGNPAIGFPYFDDKGNIVAVKKRSILNKDFRCIGAPQVFFGTPNLKKGEPLVVVEGEADLLALAEVGVNAVSVPNGAPMKVSEGRIDPSEDGKFKFLWAAKEYIDAAERIVIATDADGPGEALAEEIARRVGKERCWRVHFPDGIKDSNEALVKLGKDSLRKIVSEAKPWPVAGLYDAYHFKDQVSELYEKGAGRGESTGYASLDELYTIMPGQVTVVTGVPSCLSAGTLITMANGSRVPIEQVKPGDKIMSLKNGMSVVDTVVNAWHSGVKPVYRMTTRRGRSVFTTLDHRFMSWDGWKPVSDISVGDAISVPSVKPPSAGGSVRDAFIAAVWLAEGSKNASGFVFTHMDGELVDKFRVYASELGWVVKPVGKYTWSVSGKKKTSDPEKYAIKKAYYYRKNGFSPEESRRLAEADLAHSLAHGLDEGPIDWLKKNGLRGMTTDTIRIPDWIFSSSPEVQAAFVGALFSCDGSAAKSGFEYSSNSEAFCIDLQDLLSRFGVNCYVRFKRTYTSGTWRLTVSGKSAKVQFASSFYVPGKQDKFLALADIGHERAGDYIPSHATKELIHHKKWHKKYAGVHIKFNQRYHHSRANVAKAARAENNYALLEKVDTDHRWDEVVEIEYISEMDVYDIEVAENSSFIANGIFAHNCGKSELVDQIMVNLAVNKHWKFGVCSFENEPRFHIAKLMSKRTQMPFFDGPSRRMEREEYEAAFDWVQNHFSFVWQDDGGLSDIDSVLDRLRVAIFRHGIRGVLVDPVNFLARDTRTTSETEWVSTLLTKLKVFAMSHGVHLWLVAHPAKLQRGVDGKIPPPKGYEISGSAHYFNKADCGVTVHRDMDEPHITQVHVWKCRFSWVGKQGMTQLIYDRRSTTYSEVPEDYQFDTGFQL